MSSATLGAGVGSVSARDGGPGPQRLGQPRPRRRRRTLERRERAGAAFVLPFLVVFLLTMVAPVIYAVYDSLYRTTLFGGTSFAGVSNYGQTFSSGDFWGGVERVAVFAAVQVPVTLALAFF